MSAFLIRWYVARAMIHVGIIVAPAGPAKTILMKYLNAYGAEVLDTIARARAK